MFKKKKKKKLVLDILKAHLAILHAESQFPTGGLNDYHSKNLDFVHNLRPAAEQNCFKMVFKFESPSVTIWSAPCVRKQ